MRRDRKLYLLAEYGNGIMCPCVFCGEILDFITVTSDRIVPGCQGGTYVFENCQPACSPCNSIHGGALRGDVKGGDLVCVDS